MARLIDAEELKKYIEDVRIRLLGHLVGKNLVADAMNEALILIPKAIDEQPTVDAVEVVRCKGCKYNAYAYSKASVYCNVYERLKFIEDYCSYGAKVDGDIDG